jgi:hypothetical protein
MLLMIGNHSQRSHQSRPRVLCAFIEAQRRAFTDGAAESTRQRRLSTDAEALRYFHAHRLRPDALSRILLLLDR